MSFAPLAIRRIRQLHHFAVIFECLLTIAHCIGSTSNPQECAITVGGLLERGLVFFQRCRGLATLQQQLAQEKAESDRLRALLDQTQIELMQLKLNTTHWDWRSRAWPLSASFGVAACPETGRALKLLPAQADAALYVAKNSGRNRVERAGR